jgi:NDP-sugar pyrophosphorylase family protein
VEAEEDGRVTGFVERPQLPYWINGGFMLFERQTLDLMANGDDVNLETHVLPRSGRTGPAHDLPPHRLLAIHEHHERHPAAGEFWQKNPPWKVWEERDS